MRVPKEKRERSLGERLGLKAERCQSPKCAAVRKPYRPGMHGQSRRRRSLSEFGMQLREKQKVKVSYGVDDQGLRRLFFAARKAKGSSAAKLIELLERRLDNAVFRLGLAASRGSAHQLIAHGHVCVNGIPARSPGYSVRVGDAVSVKAGSASKFAFAKRKEALLKYQPPEWLALEPEKLQGKVLALPQEPSVPFEASLLVESFSK